LVSDFAKRLDELEEKILQLAREGFQGNYIAKLVGEGYTYDEVYFTIKDLQAQGKLKRRGLLYYPG